MVARKQAAFNCSDCVTTAKTQVARVEMRALEIVGRSSGVFDLPSGLFRNIKAVSARYRTVHASSCCGGKLPLERKNYRYRHSLNHL